MKTRILQTIGIIGMIALLGSCDRTRIVSSFEAPNTSKEYDNLYVVGLSGELLPADAMETSMVNELIEQGYTATGDDNTFDHKMDTSDESRSKVEHKLQSKGYDAVLTFSYVGLEEDVDYVDNSTPRAYYPVSYGYYNDYWNYYGFYAPETYRTGYYESETIYTMEANLYDLESGKLVWGVRSETVEPIDADFFAENFAESVVRTMERDNIITKTSEYSMK